MLIGFSRPVQVIKQRPGISATDHFPGHLARSGEFMEGSAASSSRGITRRRTPPRAADCHFAVRSHSVWPQPDSGSCQSGAPAQLPPSARPASPAAETLSGPWRRWWPLMPLRRKGSSAIPAWAAASLSWSNSSWVSANCTVFGRGTACRDRRRTTSSATMTTSRLRAGPFHNRDRARDPTRRSRGPDGAYPF